MLKFICRNCRSEQGYNVEDLIGCFFFCKSCRAINLVLPAAEIRQLPEACNSSRTPSTPEQKEDQTETA